MNAAYDFNDAGPQRDPDYTYQRTAATDPVASFRAALEAAGLMPGEIIADGIIHRCALESKASGKDGSYILHIDAPASGQWWNWREGTSETWTGKNGHVLTAGERHILADRVRADRAAREEEQAARHAEARTKAASIWEAAQPARDDHPYLIKKGFPALAGIRESRGALVLPVLDGNGAIASLQFIQPDGGKRFLTGGKMAGGFIPIRAANEDGPLYVAEGYATASTIHMATGCTVLAAFNVSA